MVREHLMDQVRRTGPRLFLHNNTRRWIQWIWNMNLDLSKTQGCAKNWSGLVWLNPLLCRKGTNWLKGGEWARTLLLLLLSATTCVLPTDSALSKRMRVFRHGQRLRTIHSMVQKESLIGSLIVAPSIATNNFLITRMAHSSHDDGNHGNKSHPLMIWIIINRCALSKQESHFYFFYITHGF